MHANWKRFLLMFAMSWLAAARRYDQLALAMNAEGIAAMFTSDGEMIDAGKTIARTHASIRAFLKIEINH